MTPKGDILDQSATMISEIEDTLEQSLRQRREAIERELEERFRRERQESELRLSQVEAEFHREKGALREYKGALADFEVARGTIETQIREHLDTSARQQKEIERLSVLTLEEIRIVGELSLKLSDLRENTEMKVNEMRSSLKEKYKTLPKPPFDRSPEPAAEFVPERPLRPAPPAAAAAALDDDENREFVVDLEQELGKLKRIKEFLETDSTSSGRAPNSVPAHTGAVQAPSAGTVLAPPESEKPPWPMFKSAPASAEPAEFKMPEINQFIRDFVRQEQEPSGSPEAAGIVRTPGADRKPAAAEDTSFQGVFQLLEKYRRSETTDYNGEISFFQNRDHLILDGESLIRIVAHIVGEAKKLYLKLGQASTPKDQFFIKQELINNQEILRKVVLRSVRMCERESCRLPRYTEDILNLSMLKDVLERLNMDNWSNQVDFAAFDGFAVQTKDAFYRRITPPAQYLRSIIQELEG